MDGLYTTSLAVYLVLAGVSLSLVFYFFRLRPRHTSQVTAPCPLPIWPFIGNLLYIKADPREQFRAFREQYGDIFRLELASKTVVVLNGLDVIKEALITRAEDFNDKSVIFVDIISNTVNKGIGTSRGEVWRQNRTFTMSVLGKLGLGKSSLVGHIQAEVDLYISHLHELRGQASDVSSITSVSVSNIICSFIIGRRYEYQDAEFQHILSILDFNFSKLMGLAILNVFPWLRYFPGDLFYSKKMAKNFEKFFQTFAKSHIKENQDFEGEPNNLIAAYMQEIKRRQLAQQQSHLDIPNLLRTILDMFFAGTETVTSTIHWFFLYMVHYPGVQQKVYEELVQVVGLESAPGIEDKPKCPYLSATLMEVQRVASLIPISIPRLTSRDVNLKGYNIPKGTEIMINFDSVLKDPALWGDDAPQFRPERFISGNGSLLCPESWIPFSLGRRVCLGASLAKMELYLFVSNIVQKFQIEPVQSGDLPNLKGQLGIVHRPLPFQVRFVSRKQ